MSGTRDSRPNPDPTALTTDLLLRELGHQDALFNTKLTALREFDAAEVAALRAQLADAKTEAKDALKLAFETSKEATTQQNTYIRETIAKSEATTTQAIQSLDALFQSNKDNNDERIGLIQNRLAATEAQTSQRRETRTETHMTIGNMVGIVSGVVGIVALLTAVLLHQTSPASPTVVSPAVIPVQPK